MACPCCAGACVEAMCENTGWACTTGLDTFRILTITFDADLTSPCLSRWSPYDAGGDCVTTEINAFSQLFFACETGTTDNKVLGMHYFNGLGADGFISGTGGLSPGYSALLSCVDGRLLLSFLIEYGPACAGTTIASSPDESLVYPSAPIDFGPMPVDCDDIDGLTASGYLFRHTTELYIPPPGIDGYEGWVSTGGIGCGYVLPQEAQDLACPDSYIPFTATISTAVDTAYEDNLGCE